MVAVSIRIHIAEDLTTFHATMLADLHIRDCSATDAKIAGVLIATTRRLP